MRNLFLLFFIAIFTFISCNEQDKIIQLNSILDASYELNNRTLNNYKGDYYMIIQENYRRKVIELNKLDLKFENLISTINNSIVNKKWNLKKIDSASNEIFKELPNIVDNRKDYLLPEFKKPKTNSNELYLKYIKNRLVIAMTYAFEYNSQITVAHCVFGELKIDSIISKQNKNGIKLTLTSRNGQTKEEKRQVLINNIKFNGLEKKIDYKLKDNYSFTDIEFDSLQKGIYKINGVLRFYEREGKVDIPFHKEFKIE